MSQPSQHNLPAFLLERGKLGRAVDERGAPLGMLLAGVLSLVCPQSDEDNSYFIVAFFCCLFRRPLCSSSPLGAGTYMGTVWQASEKEQAHTSTSVAPFFSLLVVSADLILEFLGAFVCRLKGFSSHYTVAFVLSGSVHWQSNHYDLESLSIICNLFLVFA